MSSRSHQHTFRHTPVPLSTYVRTPLASRPPFRTSGGSSSYGERAIITDRTKFYTDRFQTMMMERDQKLRQNHNKNTRAIQTGGAAGTTVIGRARNIQSNHVDRGLQTHVDSPSDAHYTPYRADREKTVQIETIRDLVK